MSLDQFTNLLYKSWLKVSGGQVQAAKVISNAIECSSNVEGSNDSGDNVNINYKLPITSPSANIHYGLLPDVDKQLSFSAIPAIPSYITVAGQGMNDGAVQNFNYPTDFTKCEFNTTAQQNCLFANNEWTFQDTIQSLAFNFSTVFTCGTTTQGEIAIYLDETIIDMFTMPFYPQGGNIWYPFSFSGMIVNGIIPGTKISVRLDVAPGGSTLASIQNTFSFYNVSLVQAP